MYCKFLGKFRNLPITYTKQNCLYSSKPLSINVLEHVMVNVKNLLWKYLYWWILLLYYTFLLISNIFQKGLHVCGYQGWGTLSWMNFIKTITVSPLYPQVPLTVYQKYLKKKIIESSKMQNWTSLHAGNNLHSIYIVIDIISNLEII